MQCGARGIGTWLGALFQGLRGTAPAKVAREAAAMAQATEQALAALACSAAWPRWWLNLSCRTPGKDSTADTLALRD